MRSLSKLSVGAAAVGARRPMPKLVHMFVGRSVSSGTLADYLSPYRTALIFTAWNPAGPTLAGMEKEVGSGVAASSRERAAVTKAKGRASSPSPPAMVKTTLFLSWGINAHFRLQSPGFSVICPSLKSVATKGRRSGVLASALTGRRLCPLNDLMISRVPFLPSACKAPRQSLCLTGRKLKLREAYAHSPSSQELEAREWGIPSQPGLPTKTLIEKINK